MVSDRSDLLVGFLIGGLVGALAGLMLAPAPGSELREDLARRAGQAAERVRAGSAAAADRLREGATPSAAGRG